jgi:hypothetical protein
VSDELRVLDELERQLIAGCYGPGTATDHGHRRRRGRRFAGVAVVARLGGKLAVPALLLASMALVIVVVAITLGLRHGRAHPQRPVRPAPHLPVVHNYAHSQPPSLPRGSVTYSKGHLGPPGNAPNPHDTFALDTTQVGLLHGGEGPTRSTLTIRASGLRAAPRGSVYAVWVAQATYTTDSPKLVGKSGMPFSKASTTILKLLPPYSLVGIIQPPIGSDGKLVARQPISVDVRQGIRIYQFELVITIERNPNAKRLGRPVLLAVIS